MIDKEVEANRQGLFEVICDALDINIADVTEETVLEDLGPVWDSVGMISVMSAIETDTNKTLSPEALFEAKTVSDVINLAFSE